MADVKACSKCNKPLRIDNTSGACGDARGCAARVKSAAAPKRGPGEDDVLSRMGFSSSSDEAPASRKKTKAVRAPKPPTVSWRDQFTVLARALGLDPEAMLEGQCRIWVEHVRTRALNADLELKQLPANTGPSSEAA